MARTGPKAKLRYEYYDLMLTITELMGFSCVSRHTLSDRLRNGWNVKKALITPVEPRHKTGTHSAGTVNREVNKNNKKAKKEFSLFAQCVARNNR